MKHAPERSSLRQAGIIGAALTALAGLALWISPGAGKWLSAVSYDALFLLRGTAPVSEVVIVAMDEESHRA